MDTDLPDVLTNKTQTRAYIVDRDTGRVLKFVKADGRRDDDDGERVFRALLRSGGSR